MLVVLVRPVRQDLDGVRLDRRSRSEQGLRRLRPGGGPDRGFLDRGFVVVGRETRDRKCRGQTALRMLLRHCRNVHRSGRGELAAGTEPGEQAGAGLARGRGGGRGVWRGVRRRLPRTGGAGPAGQALARRCCGDSGAPVGPPGRQLRGQGCLSEPREHDLALVERLAGPALQCPCAGQRDLRGVLVRPLAATRQTERRLAVGEHREVDGLDEGSVGGDRLLDLVGRLDRPGAVQRTLARLEERGGEADGRHRAGTRRALAQDDGGAEAVRDTADDEETEALLAERVGCRRRPDLEVRCLELGGGHAEPVVDDLDDDVVADDTRLDLDRRLGLREDRGVLEELREQVGRAEGVEAVHLRVDRELELDAVVLLDLGRGRADHVGQRHRLTDAAARVDAGQDEQRLGVAAHPGGEVVEAEQVREGVRVFLGTLEGVDERQLAVEEHLVTSRDVDEHLSDRPTQGGLLLGDLQGRRVDRVERCGKHADLVA